MKRKIVYALVMLGLLFSCNNSKNETEKSASQEIEKPTNKVKLSSEVIWEQLNPARGEKSPLAGTLWGNRKADVATGYLGKFADGFSSPPHIHNVTYRAIVIKGSIHNDDPSASKMWMKNGSFWTQPVGEAHITAAKGEENMAYIEIDEGPYLVNPIEDAFDNGERPINIDATNIVWLESNNINWVDPKSGVSISYLWEHKTEVGLKGLFVKLPKNYNGTIETFGNIFYSIVVDGVINYTMPETEELKILDEGSCFSSSGNSKHQIANKVNDEVILYFRTNGKIKIN